MKTKITGREKGVKLMDCTLNSKMKADVLAGIDITLELAIEY